MSATVAIIMRAKNEMPHVKRCLDMLPAQSFRDYDLFVFDSGSSDGTYEVLQKTCAADRLTQIPPADYMPGKVLNQAISGTEHEFLVLLNADAVPMSEN